MPKFKKKTDQSNLNKIFFREINILKQSLLKEGKKHEKNERF